MKIYLLLLLALVIPACKKPDPYFAVRKLRHQYELSMDLTLNSAGDLTCEAKAKNMSGKQELLEVTAIIKLLDKDQKPIWTKKIEIDVSDTGHYATAVHSFKENIGITEYEYEVIELAPDDEGSDFKSYREYMRVATP